MKYSKQRIEAIEAIENTLKKLDINQHKQLIDLLNEYNNKLKADDDYVYLSKLQYKISWVVFQNKLKSPPGVSELMATLTSLQSKANFRSGF